MQMTLTYFVKGIFYGGYGNRQFWIKLLIIGRGFSIKDSTVHPLTFSQRNGFEKYLKIGKWVIAYLPKNNNK
jgi:hypothetical protein